jgi:hypothetical protein
MHSTTKLAAAVAAIALMTACGGDKGNADSAGVTTGATTSTIAPAPTTTMPPTGMSTGATTGATTGTMPMPGATTGATTGAKTKTP